LASQESVDEAAARFERVNPRMALNAKIKMSAAVLEEGAMMIF
jgi:hypothetical protein